MKSESELVEANESSAKRNKIIGIVLAGVGVVVAIIGAVLG
jgi:hypothetical protein